MSSSSLRTVVGLGRAPYERLYYGYSTVTGLVRTGLQVADDIPTALAHEDGYEERADELIEYATKHWRPTVDISKGKVRLAQQAITAFSRGDDTCIEA